MDLINQYVSHPSFGKGQIQWIEGNIIGVIFADAGEKKFLFPDIFESYLLMTDQKASRWIQSVLEERRHTARREIEEREEKQLHLKREKRRILALEEMIHRYKTKKNALHPSSQIFFCCSKEELGQIFAEKKIYCGKLTADGYEKSFVRAARIQVNSGGLLTVCENEQPESRYIAGLFMIDDVGTIEDKSNGYVKFHPQYFLELPKKYQLRFLDFYKGAAIKSIRYRYFENEIMAKILYTLTETMRDSAQAELMSEWLGYFCKLNQINMEELSEGSSD